MSRTKVEQVIVLGGGSAGLIAALTLKRRLPALAVRVIRSAEIGIIGVGVGSTAYFPKHFFEYLQLKPKQFYAEVEPTWKLGLRFLTWGSRPDFFYTFASEHDHRYPDLPRNTAFYQHEMSRWLGRASALLAQDKAFARRADGAPDLNQFHAFHMENHKLVKWLENTCQAIGVEITEGRMHEVERGPEGDIAALHLESGERVAADLFVDASGFRSELLGEALWEPFVDYNASLFCDRAVIAGWARTDEPIRPYTTCETMESGWCWQIEHETWINRGYVYSSRFMSDDEARAELLAKNPKISNEPRLVRFRAGRYARGWVKNVVAIGNASGFVEPLEATALQVICVQSRGLADTLLEGMQLAPPPSGVAVYNALSNSAWDETRDFLAVHYAFNTRLDNAFWRACRAETELAGAAPVVEYYRENGPTSLGRHFLVSGTNSFQLDGYLALLCGQQAPHTPVPPLTGAEEKTWRIREAALAAEASRGFQVKQALECLRSPKWKWA